MTTILEPRTQRPNIKINRKRWGTLTKFKGHAGQQQLLDLSDDPQYRFFVWICGRRWGKSLVAAQWVEPTILIPGARVWVVSKTYDLARKVIREIHHDVVENFMTPGGLKLTSHQKSGPIVLEFPWGATLEGKSAENPDSLTGEELDAVVFDESASCSASAWEFYLRPTLSSRMGKALFIGTPRGYNWIYDFWKRGNDPEFPEWTSYKGPSWENPHLPMEDVEEARRTLSESAFAQEYGADFTIYTGQVFKGFDEFVHVIPEDELDLNPEWTRFRTIDFGYENPFVCLYIAVDPSDRIFIYDEYYQRHRTVEHHADVLNEHQESHTTFEYTTCDPSGASERATLLENGIYTLAARSLILPGLELVREQLQPRDDGKPGLYVSSRCLQTIQEFNLYAYPEKGLTSELPRKEHDHCMDALRYFIVNWKRGYIQQSAGRYA